MSRPATQYRTLTYADTVPSLNRIATRGSRHAVHREKKRWQEIIAQLLLLARLPRELPHVSAHASLRFPVARRRDAGNHAWLLDKALGDALTQLGVVADDTPEHYEFTGLTFEATPGPKRTLIFLSWA
jgi:hypothetical protein